MSLDAIKQVTQAETENKQRKAEAAAAAKKLVTEAENAGREALRAACEKAETATKELLIQAENCAAVRAAEMAAQSKQECAALCRAAEKRLGEAASLIIRRVVNN